MKRKWRIVIVQAESQFSFETQEAYTAAEQEIENLEANGWTIFGVAPGTASQSVMITVFREIAT